MRAAPSCPDVILTTSQRPHLTAGKGLIVGIWEGYTLSLQQLITNIFPILVYSSPLLSPRHHISCKHTCLCCPRKKYFSYNHIIIITPPPPKNIQSDSPSWCIMSFYSWLVRMRIWTRTTCCLQLIMSLKSLSIYSSSPLSFSSITFPHAIYWKKLGHLSCGTCHILDLVDCIIRCKCSSILCVSYKLEVRSDQIQVFLI